MATSTTTAGPPSSTTSTEPNILLQTLQSQGFVIIPNLLTPSTLATLQSLAHSTATVARSGNWPYVRTVPHQFPPWPLLDPNSTIPHPNLWGIQHLLHPQMPSRLIYAACYFSTPILSIVKSILSLPLDSSGDDLLVMELMQLLISPGFEEDFQLMWHRDDIHPDWSDDEEARLLAEKSPGGRQVHAQYNIALTKDESLIVVPGSHRRVRTKVEREAQDFERLEGQMVVKLEAGDAVFYDSNILHRAEYKGIDEETEVGRLTLHGSVGVKGFGGERARQVLQHDVGKWIGEEGAGFEGLGEVAGVEVQRRAEGMRRRLMEMGSGEGVGYSLS